MHREGVQVTRKNRGLFFPILPLLHPSMPTLQLPDSILMSLAVIAAWLSHTHSSRTPRRSASSFNTHAHTHTNTFTQMLVRTHTHTFWWAQLILRKHSSVRHCYCPPLRSLNRAPPNTYRRESKRGRGVDTPCPEETPLIQTCPVFWSQQLRNAEKKKKKKKRIPEEQQEMPRVYFSYSTSCTRDITARALYLPDNNAMDTTRLLSNWSRAVTFTWDAEASRVGRMDFGKSNSWLLFWNKQMIWNQKNVIYFKYMSNISDILAV